MSETEEVRAAFVELWGQMSGFWGIPPGTARVHAWLLSRSDPQDAEAISTGLGMSRGAVSMAVHDLREWGLVTSERAPGGRRALIRPETDPERLVRSVVQNRRRREWLPIRERVDDWIPRLSGERGPDAAVLRDRLERLGALVRTADALAESFVTGGTLRSLGLRLLVSRAMRRRSRR
jgi:DNA-binding transcriptional regulator GbsR (MarR family)